MMSWWGGLAAALASGLVAAVVIAIVRALALRHELLDIPGHRSAHRHPKPRLGGVGVVIAVAAGALGLTVLDLPGARVLLTLTMLSVVVAGVGLIDDVWSLPILPRLIVHAVVAVVTVQQLGGATTVTLAPNVVLSFGAAGTVATVIYVVALINAFNFMDGIDGIAGAQAASAAAAWVAIAWLTATPATFWAGALLVGASLGFLWHNWEPSSIFLGDAGATFLGYWLAVLPLAGNVSHLFVPGLLVVWPFLADAGFTLIDRARRQQSLTSGHQEHVYQRLVASGWPHRRVALLYAALSLAGGMAAIALAGRLGA